MKRNTQLKGSVLLLITAFIWGSSFVAQSIGMEKIEAFTFNGIRTVLGVLVLLPIVIVRNIKNSSDRSRAELKASIKYGILLGIVFCMASNFQQFAFYDSTSGKIAFITALYMFFVPILGLFLKKRVSGLTWVCVILGFIGLFFLCIDPKNIGAINKGDVMAFICSIFFAVHILMVERFAPETDGITLSCTQFAVSGLISIILMFIFESPHILDIRAAALPIMYSGFLSCGVAYTLQIIGQKYTEATIASLLMCAESVFAVITAAIVLHEMMLPRELIGCAIMFTAIILSQFSNRE